jgi:hypothetical protein
MPSPYKKEPARYKKELVIRPSIFGLTTDYRLLFTAYCSLDWRSREGVRPGSGSISGKKKGIAD